MSVPSKKQIGPDGGSIGHRNLLATSFSQRTLGTAKVSNMNERNSCIKFGRGKFPEKH